MRPGLTISCLAHAAALLWGLVAFAAKPNDAPAVEPLPVEFVSATEFSQLTAGVKNAPKVLDQPKPPADKVGEANPAKQLAAKVADKPEVTTDSAPPPEPKPEPKPQAKAEPKPEPKPEKPEAKPEPKPAEKAEKLKQPEVKPDPIAEELKKQEAKKPPKPEKKEPQFKPDQIAEQLKKDEAKKPPTKFDAHQVAALLDKRDPQRRVATAETLNGAVSLGAPQAHAAQLSQSELDALRARLIQCWSPPPGVAVDSKLYVVLRVLFKPDGSLVHEPGVIEDSASALGPALAESAKRALMLCQPFTMLKPEHYDLWKDIEIKFNNELFGG
jgi:outer membrane biosynthesis protein TonB